MIKTSQKSKTRVHYLTFHNNDFVALRTATKSLHWAKITFQTVLASLPTENGILHLFSVVSIPSWYPNWSFQLEISENWQPAKNNQIWSSLGSKLTTFIDGILPKLLFQWLKKGSVCINFLFEAKWRSTTWFTTFWNLHIFVTFAEFAAGKMREEKLFHTWHP